MIASIARGRATRIHGARATRIRGAALVVALTAACAPAPPRRAAPPPTGPPVLASEDAGADAPPPFDDVASLDDLARRGPSEAPLMREIVRAADATRPTEVAAAGADTCFRAAVVASRPARAWFEDGARAPLGEAAAAGLAIVLVPPRGPVCARKGERLRLVVEPEGTPAVARAVVWQAP